MALYRKLREWGGRFLTYQSWEISAFADFPEILRSRDCDLKTTNKPFGVVTKNVVLLNPTTFQGKRQYLVSISTGQGKFRQ